MVRPRRPASEIIVATGYREMTNVNGKRSLLIREEGESPPKWKAKPKRRPEDDSLRRRAKQRNKRNGDEAA